MLFKSPRGTKDILPLESSRWRAVESKVRSIFSLFSYQEVRTPIFEEAKLFCRSLGDFTDIVQKQMFTIKKDTDTFVLRPEATASIIRSYVENTFYNDANIAKFYYMGPMFRAERPQKGRLRQFHQFGCEAIGALSPYVDAETIALAACILDNIGVKGYEIVCNTLGCMEDKKRFGHELKERLLPHKKVFCEDCQDRMTKNVFRVLDCKNPQCKEHIISIGVGSAHLCEDCRKHFDGVREALDLLGVSYKLNPFLVRGLDYYTRTVFEITHSGLGSQDALGAGGRYDNLVEELGGPSRGAVGFAFGLERLFLAIGDGDGVLATGESVDCYLIPLGDAAMKKCFQVLHELRAANVKAELDYLEGSLKAKLRRADKTASKFCLIIGDNELVKNTGILKNMRQSTQEEISLDQIVEKIKLDKTQV